MERGRREGSDFCHSCPGPTQCTLLGQGIQWSSPGSSHSTTPGECPEGPSLQSHPGEATAILQGPLPYRAPLPHRHREKTGIAARSFPALPPRLAGMFWPALGSGRGRGPGGCCHVLRALALKPRCLGWKASTVTLGKPT